MTEVSPEVKEYIELIKKIDKKELKEGEVYLLPPDDSFDVDVWHEAVKLVVGRYEEPCYLCILAAYRALKR